jgi:hypothetical protein
MNLEQFQQIRQELENTPRVTFILPSDLLMLPHAVRDVLNQAFREGGITLAALTVSLDLDPVEAGEIADILIQKGYLQKNDDQDVPVYTARLGGRIKHPGESPLDKI